mmetsp:Transcript_164693/g.528360  ORF Transcript_164693/g.528360 Transcript_164693/m.528360 type:complete len:317 (-) Transcript_164693:635-1585(-)
MRPEDYEQEGSNNGDGTGLWHGCANRDTHTEADQRRNEADPLSCLREVVPEAQLLRPSLNRRQRWLVRGRMVGEEEPAHGLAGTGGEETCDQHDTQRLGLEGHGEELPDENQGVPIQRRDILRHRSLEEEHQAATQEEDRNVQDVQDAPVLLRRGCIIQVYGERRQAVHQAMDENFQAIPLRPLHPLDHREDDAQILLLHLRAVAQVPLRTLHVVDGQSCVVELAVPIVDDFGHLVRPNEFAHARHGLGGLEAPVVGELLHLQVRLHVLPHLRLMVGAPLLLCRRVPWAVSNHGRVLLAAFRRLPVVVVCARGQRQ